MTSFEPRLDVLPSPQRRLWPELASTPGHFTLYGGTAVALRLGHRSSIDFDFSSREPFDPDRLAAAIPYLVGSERIQIDVDTLTCRVDRGGPVLVSFFGRLGIGQVSASEEASGLSLRVASLMDLAGTKVALVQKRAQSRDYVDIDALIGHGIDLSLALAAARAIYGTTFNPVISLKALSYYDDVPDLPQGVSERLRAAVAAVDPTRLPMLMPYRERSTDTGERT